MDFTNCSVSAPRSALPSAISRYFGHFFVFFIGRKDIKQISLILLDSFQTVLTHKLFETSLRVQDPMDGKRSLRSL